MRLAPALLGDRPSDADTIRASHEDPRMFAEIFERHFEAVHGYLRARLGGFLADDVAAETFTRAFDARERFDLHREDARPWLFGIATNLTRDHWRAERRRLRALGRLDPHAAIPSDDDAAISRSDATARASELAAALRALRPDDRDALLLVVWAELSYEDAAQAVGVPIGTIRSRVHRARAAVRAALEPDHAEGGTA